MKPLGHSNSSVFAYLVLMILLFIPVLGDIALLICAIFVKDRGIRNFARAILILAVIGYVFMFATGEFNIDSFEIFPDNRVEAFNSFFRIS